MHVQDLLFKIISEMLKNKCGEYCQIYVIPNEGMSFSADEVEVYYDDETGELVLDFSTQEEE